MTRRQLCALVATIIGSGIVFLDSTVVNIALPALSRDLGARFSDLQWVVDGYLLTLSALILVSGSLGDIYGRKRIYLIGLICFGATSILCGLAQDTAQLIASRIIQGISAALLVPGGLAIINTNFPTEIRGRAIGLWAAWSGISTIIGPLVGGYLIDAVSWRWIFFINVPLVVACFLLAFFFIKETKDTRPRSIDIAGSVLTAGFLALVTYGLIEGPAMQWRGLSIEALAAGTILFLCFLFIERRVHDPIVDLRLFTIRNFTGANIMTFGMYGALAGFFFALVVYLQTTAGYSGLEAGLAGVPATILLLIFSGRMGAITHRFGPRLFMTAGPIIAGLGMLLLLDLTPHMDYVTRVLPGVVLFGIGLTLFVTPLTMTVMSSVDPGDSGIASGINNAVSRAAGLVVIALLGIFGAESAYHVAVILCAALSILSGVASFLIVRDPTDA